MKNGAQSIARAPAETRDVLKDELERKLYLSRLIRRRSHHTEIRGVNHVAWSSEYNLVKGIKCFQPESEGRLVTDGKSAEHRTIEISKPV